MTTSVFVKLIFIKEVLHQAFTPSTTIRVGGGGWIKLGHWEWLIIILNDNETLGGDPNILGKPIGWSRI